MLAIYKREMRAYFSSPIGYIFIAVFLAASGFMFSVSTLLAGTESDISSYFAMMIYVLLIVVPLLTMKLFSEERKTKTEQLLLTAPVSLPGMVFAKFLAAYTMFAITFLVSCINLFSLYEYGNPNTADLIGYIIAILFVGSAYVAVGTFISSLTENQLVSAIGTIAVLAALILASAFNESIDFAPLRAVLSWVSIYSRFYNFTYGIFDVAATFYYISICFVFLFLTVRVFEKRRWE
ncbi:MAG: ABC transporter [Ruminococcaceae bacterium]|nr:ABC transporter [Oscillospiraceae bacterium]